MLIIHAEAQIYVIIMCVEMEHVTKQLLLQYAPAQTNVRLRAVMQQMERVHMIQ